MNKLIKITTNEEGKQLVSARDLYLGLGLNKTQWSRWYPKNIEQNEYFSENIDFIGVRHNVEGNEVQDFAISLDFAKHIAMMARTEKSHEYRNYFLECEKEVLNTSQLSPELQMFNQMFKALANNELEQKQLKQEIKETKQEIQGIRDVVSLTPNQWRKDTASLITKIAVKLGGFEHISDVRKESYKLLNEAYGVNLKARLVNKQKNMALEGTSKSKINKVTYLDVIAEDKKLINGYLSIIGKMAISSGVGGNCNE